MKPEKEKKTPKKFLCAKTCKTVLWNSLVDPQNFWFFFIKMEKAKGTELDQWCKNSLVTIFFWLASLGMGVMVVYFTGSLPNNGFRNLEKNHTMYVLTLEKVGMISTHVLLTPNQQLVSFLINNNAQFNAFNYSHFVNLVPRMGSKSLWSVNKKLAWTSVPRKVSHWARNFQVWGYISQRRQSRLHNTCKLQSMKSKAKLDPL